MDIRDCDKIFCCYSKSSLRVKIVNRLVFQLFNSVFVALIENIRRNRSIRGIITSIEGDYLMV